MIAILLSIIFSQGDTCLTCAYVTAEPIKYHATSSYAVTALAADAIKNGSSICFQTHQHGCVDLDSLLAKIDEILAFEPRHAVVTEGSTK